MIEGYKVKHADFGIGVIEDILGDIVRVNFFGEKIDVNRTELIIETSYAPPVRESSNHDNYSKEKIELRRAFEAINLGVVPPDSQQLINLTIGLQTQIIQIKDWLAKGNIEGLCKTVFGFYGTGKSHFLKLVRHLALEAGWAVSYLEFDPKEADPAKPHLVYRNLMATLEFPEREDGTKTEGFFGFIKEIRDNWYSKSIRSLTLFKASPWFSHAFEILIHYPHSENEDYLAACNWLGGDYKSYDKITKLGREKGYRHKLPRMPVTKETADIYVFHLAVIGELCRTLGYKGYLLIFDEAEHIRGYNIKRKERANNFFDILSRCAHAQTVDDYPALNEHGYELPAYWLKGTHFGLFVGLTQGDTFTYPVDNIRDACVFVFEPDDCVFLKPPLAKEYESWCIKLLSNFHKHYPSQTCILGVNGNCNKIAKALREIFESVEINDLILRNWVKLAGLVLCIILSKENVSIDFILANIKRTASQYVNLILPWEE